MDKLKFIAQQMKKLSIPYAFGEWTKETQDPYWVGEYTESAPGTEDGAEESVFILTGTTRKSWSELEQQKSKIKKHFPDEGCRGETESGTIAVFFSAALMLPTGEADLKRIQINLDVKEWRKKQ
jgi:hypothetical protein